MKPGENDNRLPDDREGFLEMMRNFDPEKYRRDFAIAALKRNGVSEADITQDKIDEMNRKLDKISQDVNDLFDRVYARIKDKDAERPAAFIKAQGPHTSYEYVLEKLFTGTTIPRDDVTKFFDRPQIVVGVNVKDVAPILEISEEKLTQSLVKKGFTVDNNGLVTNHPAFKPYKPKRSFMERIGLG